MSPFNTGMRRSFLVAFAAVTWLHLGISATIAQCIPGFIGDGGIAGTNAEVRATVLWDPDGPGPQPERLVIAGTFTQAGSEATGRIVSWDGTSWSSFSTGMDGPVYALATFQGSLIAAGQFVLAGDVTCNSIARWNGTQWEPLGLGLTFQSGLPVIYALAVYQGQLHAAGLFGASTGGVSRNVARWDGSSWLPLGQGAGLQNSAQNISSLAIAGGLLYAGGTLTTAGGIPVSNIAAWDGTQWSSPAGGVDAPVLAMASLNDELIVGGGFATAGSVAARGIARWNGQTWDDPTAGHTQVVNALGVLDGQLFAGGLFENGTAARNTVAQLVTGQWNLLDPGPILNIRTLQRFDNRVVIGGGSGVPRYIAQWSAGAWAPLRPEAPAFSLYDASASSPINALTSYRGDLIACGTFRFANSSPRSIARWTGTDWQPLGTGSYMGNLMRMCEYNGSLIAIGQFLPTALANIAEFNGSTWNTLGNGLNNTVTAIGVHDGSLYASGIFTASASISLPRVAQWDGATWQPMGTGFTRGARALISHNGDLYAGADGALLNGVTNSTVVKWNGTAWERVGVGISAVTSLASYNGQLYASGTFSSVGGTPARQIARWNGTAWTAAGNGLDLPAFTMIVHDGRLIATASFDGSGALHAWDGIAWTGFGGPSTGSVIAAHSYRNEIVIGGSFQTAGGKVARHLARWSQTGLPWITTQVSSSCTSAPTITAVVPGGYGPATYRWNRNGAPISDGQSPSGSGAVISGASTQTLSIAAGTPADRGNFTLRVALPCNSIQSDPVTLSFCLVDFNCSGALETQDIFDFLGAWFAGSLSADFDRSGSLSVNDLFAYLNAWFTSCS